jgi:hypothetical protein
MHMLAAQPPLRPEQGGFACQSTWQRKGNGNAA